MHIVIFMNWNTKQAGAELCHSQALLSLNIEAVLVNQIVFPNPLKIVKDSNRIVQQLFQGMFCWFRAFPLLFQTMVVQYMVWVGAGGNKIKADSAQLSSAGTWAELGNKL